MKKNQLSAKQQELNNALADQYNSKGKFPLTLLLNAEGKILQQWDGFPALKPEEFRSLVKGIIDTDH